MKKIADILLLLFAGLLIPVSIFASSEIIKPIIIDSKETRIRGLNFSEENEKISVRITNALPIDLEFNINNKYQFSDPFEGYRHFIIKRRDKKEISFSYNAEKLSSHEKNEITVKYCSEHTNCQLVFFLKFQPSAITKNQHKSRESASIIREKVNMPYTSTQKTKRENVGYSRDRVNTNNNSSISINKPTISIQVFIILLTLLLFILLYLIYNLKSKAIYKKYNTIRSDKDNTIRSDKTISTDNTISTDKTVRLDNTLKDNSSKKQIDFDSKLNDANKKLEKRNNQINDLKTKIVALTKEKQSELISKNEEQHNFKKELYALTINMISQSVFFEQSNFYSAGQEWSIAYQEEMLKKLYDLNKRNNDTNKFNMSVEKALKPFFDFFKIPYKDILNQGTTPDPALFATQFNYLKKQDIDTPIFIKHFEYYLDYAIAEVNFLNKNAKIASTLANAFESIYEEFYNLKNELGTSTDRSQLLRHFSLQTHFDMRKIDSETFYETLVDRYFTTGFSELLKLHMYKNAFYKDFAVKIKFEQAYIDEERFDQLVILTKLYFKNLFKIHLLEIDIFNEKFNSKNYDVFYGQPYLTDLFPDFSEFQEIKATLKKDMIIDVFEVGFISDNPHIESKKTVVITN